FHLVTATVWVGGLIALVVIRPSLGSHLQVTVRRYSVVAGWCFLLLVGSGLLAAWINMGALAGLASRYGVLLILKTIAAVLLGVAGWWHRHRAIAALGDMTKGDTPFTR